MTRVLIDNLEEKMKGTPAEGALAKLFMGKVLNYIKCVLLYLYLCILCNCIYSRLVPFGHIIIILMSSSLRLCADIVTATLQVPQSTRGVEARGNLLRPLAQREGELLFICFLFCSVTLIYFFFPLQPGLLVLRVFLINRSQGCKNVYDSFDNYVAEELLEGPNQYMAVRPQENRKKYISSQMVICLVSA